SREATHGFYLIQRIFHGWVAEVIDELHDMNAQHHIQRVGFASYGALGVMTTELLFEFIPGNQGIHFFEKSFTTGFALLNRIFGFSKGQLSHGDSLEKGKTLFAKLLEVFQRFPNSRRLLKNLTFPATNFWIG